MTEPDRTQSEQDHEQGAAFRLRSDGPPVMRLSRRVLSGLIAVGAVVIFGGLIVALYQGNRRPGGDPELYNTDNKTTPDGLSTLPRDYVGSPQDKPASDIPRLGPPVPGDLGRPVSGPGADLDGDQQRLAQESEAARTSHLFATTGTRDRSGSSGPEAAAAVAGMPPHSARRRSGNARRLFTVTAMHPRD